jgi:hypothetical protein
MSALLELREAVVIDLVAAKKALSKAKKKRSQDRLLAIVDTLQLVYRAIQKTIDKEAA